MDYSIPGIQNPSDADNYKQIKDSDFDGSVDLPIYGPFPRDYQAPHFRIIIAQESGREVKVLFRDEKEEFVIPVEHGDEKTYYLRIPNDKLLLARGSYVLRVFIGDILQVYYLRVRNNPDLPNKVEYKFIV